MSVKTAWIVPDTTKFKIYIGNTAKIPNFQRQKRTFEDEDPGNFIKLAYNPDFYRFSEVLPKNIFFLQIAPVALKTATSNLKQM